LWQVNTSFPIFHVCLRNSHALTSRRRAECQERGINKATDVVSSRAWRDKPRPKTMPIRQPCRVRLRPGAQATIGKSDKPHVQAGNPNRQHTGPPSLNAMTSLYVRLCEHSHSLSTRAMSSAIPVLATAFESFSGGSGNPPYIKGRVSARSAALLVSAICWSMTSLSTSPAFPRNERS